MTTLLLDVAIADREGFSWVVLLILGAAILLLVLCGDNGSRGGGSNYNPPPENTQRPTRVPQTSPPKRRPDG